MNEKLDYFIESTNERLTRMENKVDKLLEFKWQILGGSLVVGVIASVVVTLIGLILK